MPKSIIMNVRLSPAEDKTIIEKICSAGSVSGYIKSLIARDIGRDYPIVDFHVKQKTASSQISSLHISLNPTSEKDIIEKLNSVPNKSDYIRSLVYDDMNSTKSKSFHQLSDEIDLDEYTAMAQFAADQFTKLAAILLSNGFIAKASECDKLAESLTAWATHTK